jgi:hypothetical protein
MNIPMEIRWNPVQTDDAGRVVISPVMKRNLRQKSEVLVQVKSEKLGMPDMICVGYAKWYSFDEVIFIVPGRGGVVKAWCDCLPSNFQYPQNMSND